MFDLIVLADIGQTIKDYISKNLIPSWVSFVVQFSALVIMVLVIFFVAYKPVRKMLTKRADYVENNIRDSETAKAEALKNVTASEETLIASKKEAAEIVANAKVIAENMKAQAEEDIERSKVEAKEQIRKEMISVALSASEEVLKREINEKDNARVVEDFIKDLDN